MEKLSVHSRVHVRIAGRVQGVYYRASALQQAQKLGLTGWVMNCPDGSVVAVAEGATAGLEEFIAWCRQGPSGARVSRIDVRWDIPGDNFTGFTIRR